MFIHSANQQARSYHRHQHSIIKNGVTPKFVTHRNRLWSRHSFFSTSAGTFFNVFGCNTGHAVFNCLTSS